MNGKDCAVCVYTETRGGNRRCISDRDKDATIIDCCVPEAPIRKLQAHCKSVQEYIERTNYHVMTVKAQSLYWRKELHLA